MPPARTPHVAQPISLRLACLASLARSTRLALLASLSLLALLALVALPVPPAHAQPSGAHPRVLLRDDVVLAWRAQQGDPDSPVARSIARCDDAIANPEDYVDGQYQGFRWVEALTACLVAHATTELPAHEAAAKVYLNALFDDQSAIGDGLGPSYNDGVGIVSQDTGYSMRTHGVFAALTGGVVFSLQGFEQATQLAGEARDPRRDLSRAIVMAMAIGAVLYSLLQLVLIGGLDPANLRGGWTAPLGTGALSYGVWYALALTLGVGWLAKMLLIDAVVSPVGAGIVYMGTTARLSYALGEERELPAALARTNARGVPVVSILVAAGVGCLALGPYKSWSALVNVVTGATAIMYAFAPVALAALREHDPDRPRAYRMPAPRVLLPAAFCSANLILYWGGFETTWKLVCAMAVGFAVFAIGARVKRTDAARGLRAASWIAPWLLGHVALGWAGRYGGGAELLPEWVDLAVVIAFSLAIFWRARAAASAPAAVAAAIERDAHQLDTLAPAPSP